MNKRTYTDEQLKVAVKTSISIREVLGKLGLKQAGGNYRTVPRLIKELQLSTEHLLGHGWSKGRQVSLKRPIEDYLSNQQRIGSYKLKKRLLREQILAQQCSGCFRKTWLKQPIPLELDHINGNSQDNRLENLRLLCPNCHSFTDTYRGRNIKTKL